jgi:hypothetical protein
VPILVSVINVMKTEAPKDYRTRSRFSGIIHLGAALRRRLDLSHGILGQVELAQPSGRTTPKPRDAEFAAVEAERAKARAMAGQRSLALIR